MNRGSSQETKSTTHTITVIWGRETLWQSIAADIFTTSILLLGAYLSKSWWDSTFYSVVFCMMFIAMLGCLRRPSKARYKYHGRANIEAARKQLDLIEKLIDTEEHNKR